MFNIFIRIRIEGEKMTKDEKNNLTTFLEYLQDKVEDCYSDETKNAIKEYLNNIKETSITTK